MSGVRLGGLAFIDGFFPYGVRIFDDGTGDVYRQIWKVPFSGGDPVQVTSHTTNATNDTDPVASPGFSTIAFLRSVSGGPARLYIMDADGSNITEIDGTNVCRGPYWHPNGSVILYRSAGTIHTIEPDGSNQTDLISQFPQNVFSPVYNSDGSRIAYTKDFTSGLTADELRVMDADGTNDTLLDTLQAGGRGGLGNSWLHGSDVIVYTDGGGTSQVYKINDDGTGKTDLTTANIGPALTKWAVPSDDSVAFTPFTTTPWTLYQVPISGAGESAVSPTLNVRQAVGAGQAIYAGGRIYTVRRTTDDLVSILPDGSDLRVEHTPENGPVFFETIEITGNGTEG